MFFKRTLVAKRNQLKMNIPLKLSSLLKQQKFDYFLVLDFEATCDNKRKIVPQVVFLLSFHLRRDFTAVF